MGHLYELALGMLLLGDQGALRQVHPQSPQTDHWISMTAILNPQMSDLNLAALEDVTAMGPFKRLEPSQTIAFKAIKTSLCHAS